MAAFLFSLHPKQEMYDWVGFHVKPEEQDRLKEIKENASLFMFGSNRYLAIGGGGYGIQYRSIFIHLNQIKLWAESGRFADQGHHRNLLDISECALDGRQDDV
jgi:hypothetical protein